ncbi:hypothetical protein N9L57_03305 [Alphaproteobacteria bacterium]|nr:hypothetical protein [Alphaproteobacteria bacterium]
MEIKTAMPPNRDFWGRPYGDKDTREQAAGILPADNTSEEVIQYALDYSEAKTQYLDPTERADIQNELDAIGKKEHEEKEITRELVELESEIQHETYHNYNDETFADPDDLGPLSSDEFAYNNEEGWPYED